ncbi:hypothetical protein EJB05_07109, partial [Eragrostis curvula]
MEATETALPDDALAGIFGRLPAHTLAACRGVCKAWRAVVDARGLLLPHVLPHAVRGIFINYTDYPRPGLFFARPSSARPAGTIDGNLGYLPASTSSDISVLDHCNGLLLYGDTRELYVVNPATRQWERLPVLPDASEYLAYLVFDPAVSLHYEVVMVPRVPEKPRHLLRLGDVPERLNGASTAGLTIEALYPTRQAPPSSWWEGELEDPCRLMEWPPPSCALHVFSSVKKRWEQRSFVREGRAVGTIEDARLDSFPWMYLGPRRRYAVYWGGALYVHCQGAFVMRLPMAGPRYQVIDTPIGIEEGKRGRSYLGRSEKGIYFATFYDYYLLRVWILDESRGEIKWELRHDIDLESSALWAALHKNNRQRIDGPWILDEDNMNNAAPKPYFDWDSDDDNILDYEDKDEYEEAYIYLLGFHPYKEIVFLMASYIGIAYHLNSSKVQYLGKLYPKDYDLSSVRGVHESFPYTPCLVGELLGTIQ